MAQGSIRLLTPRMERSSPTMAITTFMSELCFIETMKAEKSAAAKKAPKKDAVAEKIAGALKRVAGKKLNLGTYGYTIRRAKGKGSKGLLVTRNVKPAKGL